MVSRAALVLLAVCLCAAPAAAGPAKDTVAPSAPTGARAIAGTNGALLVWRDDRAAVRYGVYADGRPLYATPLPFALVALTCATEHTLGVDAVDRAGMRSSVTTVRVTTRPCPAPAPPTGLTASATTSGVTLRWQASTDSRVTGYDVDLDGALVATTAGTGYTVTVRCGTTHELGVDAVAGSTRSARATITVTTPECEGGGPALHVSPNGSDAGLCLEAAPCASFDRAYHLAFPGQRVVVAGGTYPTQTVTVDPTKLEAPANVVIAPAEDAKVELAGDLVVDGSHVTFRDLKLRKLVSRATAGAATSHDVVFDNLDGETFNIGPNYRIAIKGGDWGPSLACHPRDSAFDASTWCPAGSPYAATGNDGGAGDWENHVGPDGEIMNQWPHAIVIDGARIHDQNSLDLEAMHTGGLFLISGYDIAIRNTVFQRNAVYDLQVQDFSTPDCCGMTFGPVHDAVLENNWFGAPVLGVNDPGGATTDDGQPDVQLDPRAGSCWSSWLIRFNSFHNGLALGLDGPACFDDVRVVGNVGEVPSPAWWSDSQCFPGAAGLTWAYNAWVGGTCGPTDVELPALPYANEAVGAENFHLTGGPAVDLVPAAGPDELLATDVDGQSRPLGAARDAGSDEAR